MNLNSRNQLWSRWTATITVPFHATHALPLFQEEMRSAVARWYRAKFGSATEMRISNTLVSDQSRFVVECRTEGAPAPDPIFRKKRMAEIARFFGENLRRYGKTDVRVDVHIEAGDVGDGTPPAQLILAPPIPIEGVESHG